MNVAWMKDNEDPFQAFLGWTAFRFSDWQWPLGMSRLIAYPDGMPLIATDSNPLVSIPLKLLSPLLPYPFQFEGWWLLISVFLSYAIAFRLLRDLSGRPVGSVLGAAFVTIAPILPFRWNHNSLIIPVANPRGVFHLPPAQVRWRSDNEIRGPARAGDRPSSLLCSDGGPYRRDGPRPQVRRGACASRRDGSTSLAPLVLGSAVIALSGLIAAWVTGMLAL